MKCKIILALALVLGSVPLSIILAVPCILLSGSAFAGANVSVGDIRITFATLSVASAWETTPQEALDTHGFGDEDHGAFTNIVAGRIAALNVTRSDLKFAKSEEEIRDFLRQLLSMTNSATYKVHIWSFGDGAPNVVASAEHTEGKPGRLFIWCNPSPGLYGAYLDGNGNWWWVYWPVRVPAPFAINKEALAWGEMEGGLQMACAVDEANGVIHCWVRNGGDTAVNYDDFDFGYWEDTGLEIRQGTNWVGLPRAWGGSYSGGGHAAGRIKPLAPKQVMTGGQWLYYELEAKYAGPITGTGGLGLKRPASFFSEDTFALDLRAFQSLAGTAHPPVQARVSQTFYPDLPGAEEKTAILYSPVFTLDGAALKFLGPENHDTVKKGVKP